MVKGNKPRGELKLRFNLSAKQPETQFTFQDNFTFCEQLLAIVAEHEIQSDPVSPPPFELKSVQSMVERCIIFVY